MILPIGPNQSRSNKHPRRAAFTLIELILVMALMMIVLGVAAPSLSPFFKGRNLDYEARRLLSLTTYGRSRAISEGIPMLLWIDPQRRTYGLQAAAGYLDYDPKSVSYNLDPNLRMEVTMPILSSAVPISLPDRVVGNRPTIRFTPDGFIALTSPVRVLIEQGKRDVVALVENTNVFRYELQPVNTATAWR
jgi:type II secretion system protein H